MNRFYTMTVGDIVNLAEIGDDRAAYFLEMIGVVV